MKKTKILLDADVVIHFYKGGLLHMLPEIFSEYKHIVLSKVHEELSKDCKSYIDRMSSTFRNISIVEFNPTGDMMKEFAMLLRNRGKGESACMAYCKFNRDVLGSSNLKDIKDYCAENNITYLTTYDFLHYAIKRGKLSIDEAREFVAAVKSKDSKLPDMDIAEYVSEAII